MTIVIMRMGNASSQGVLRSNNMNRGIADFTYSITIGVDHMESQSIVKSKDVKMSP